MIQPTPTDRLMRRLRGVAVGLLTGVLAACAHVAADGRLPDLGVVAPLVGLLAWTASAFARRELTPARILALVGGGQLAMHVSLVLASHPHGAHLSTSGPMVSAHVVATLAVVAALAGAERSLFALTAAIAAVLPRRLTPLPVAAPLVIGVAPVPAQHVVAPVLLRDVLSWRGPPARLG